MSRFLIPAAYIINFLMMAVALVIASQAYGRDVFLALMLIIPPALSIIALRSSPDAEERTLARAVRKARLRRELADLGGDK